MRGRFTPQPPTHPTTSSDPPRRHTPSPSSDLPPPHSPRVRRRTPAPSPQIRRRPSLPRLPPHPTLLSPDPTLRNLHPLPGDLHSLPTAGSYSGRGGGLLHSLPDGGLHSLPVRWRAPTPSPTAASSTPSPTTASTPSRCGRRRAPTPGAATASSTPSSTAACTPSRCGLRRNPTPGAAATSALLRARRDLRGHEVTTSANRNGDLRRPQRRRRGGRWRPTAAMAMTQRRAAGRRGPQCRVGAIVPIFGIFLKTKSLPRVLPRLSVNPSPSVRFPALGEGGFPVKLFPGPSSPRVALEEGFPECNWSFPECILHPGKTPSPVVMTTSSHD
jgi:hypothetical protein